MSKSWQFTRPSLQQALTAWTTILSQAALPSEVIWIYDENLCFERDSTEPGGFRLGFQVTLTPAPPDAEKITFEHFAESHSRLVFYRVGSCQGRSVCLMLCDPWFESKSEAEGFLKRDDWLMSFRVGGREELMEIKDEERWKARILRGRPLHDLDFCMTLRAIHETLAHGRVLSPYERYALRFLSGWRRLLGEQH